MPTTYHDAVTDAGERVKIQETYDVQRSTYLDGSATQSRGLSSWKGPDGEQLTPDGPKFRGVHSGILYALT